MGECCAGRRVHPIRFVAKNDYDKVYNGVIAITSIIDLPSWHLALICVHG